MPAVLAPRHRLRYGPKSQLPVSVGEILLRVVLVRAAKAHTGEDSDEEDAESREAGTDYTDIDFNDGPDGNVELDVALIFRVPIVLNEQVEAYAANDCRTSVL